MMENYEVAKGKNGNPLALLTSFEGGNGHILFSTKLRSEFKTLYEYLKFIMTSLDYVTDTIDSRYNDNPDSNRHDNQLVVFATSELSCYIEEFNPSSGGAITDELVGIPPEDIYSALKLFSVQPVTLTSCGEELEESD